MVETREENRESWRSQTGFVLAAIGSAIGLANIMRFPHIVGKHGGAAFIIVYLLCLAFVSIPVLISEVLIGRTTQSSPRKAFSRLGRGGFWSLSGGIIVCTGFIVSAFYSALAGWILGYLVEAMRGNLTHFSSGEEAISHYQALISSPWWGIVFHGLFMLLCAAIVYTGVRNGIERSCKWMMPVLFGVLLLLVLKGLHMKGAKAGLAFLFTPDWSALTPTAFLVALGQSFFTVSAGQGTMITYGSYLSKSDNVLRVCLPIVVADTLISLLSAVAVFTIVFSAGMEPGGGLGLIFHTLPVVFSQLPAGYFLAILFFLFVVIAAITSEISAMEPVIAFIMDEWGWRRHSAVTACAIGAFVVGIPCALASSVLSGSQPFGMSWLELFDGLATGFLIPIGGFLAVVLVGWRWGFENSFSELEGGALPFFRRNPWIEWYFRFSLKYGAPILIILVFMSALGFFK